MKRVVRLLSRLEELTPRQRAQIKYRKSLKGRIAARRHGRKQRQDAAYRAKQREYRQKWEKANKARLLVYKRTWLKMYRMRKLVEELKLAA